MLRLIQYIVAVLVLGLVATLGVHLYEKGKPDDSVDSAKKTGEIIVLTVNGPTTYYENAAGQLTGLEYELATRFAAEVGLKVRFEILPSESELINALKARRGHIVAGTLSPTPERDKRVRFGPAYSSHTQQVVYRIGGAKPRSIEELVGKRIGVLTRSHHAERLTELKKKFKDLKWTEFDNESTDDLLKRLSDEDLDVVIADSTWIALSQNLYPNIDIAFDLGKPEMLRWAFSLAGDDFLYKEAKKFFARIEKSGELKQLVAQHLGNTRRLVKTDMETFLQRVQTMLPKYRPIFQEAQEITGLDWRLLAAISYHESHWNPLATSPTNVRGIMMLTEDTADRLNVKNRLDAKESIIAGAKYLVLLKGSLPPRIPEPDRTWLAIAAYNQGLGHLEDARILTQRLKRDPDAWIEVKAVMPLLSDPNHYQTLKRGYARGGEAVIMTETVRMYFAVLARIQGPYKPPLTLAVEDSK
ncbi:MAG TPA: membrane-bound lytic murein transglycosylase MltF [Burkholderiales bacterium]|nr:membrane-bound lytic murein transglycosylase MltF [Burkholderiales bacterium]